MFVLPTEKILLLEWKQGAWLSAVSWQGFCPFGHEGSCQLLSIRVSTAVTVAAYIELNCEDIRGLSGKYKKNMSCSLRGLTVFLSDYSVQNQLMNTNLPPPQDRQMQMAVSLLGYKASLVLPSCPPRPSRSPQTPPPAVTLYPGQLLCVRERGAVN
jgi:hypothetical protein